MFWAGGSEVQGRVKKEEAGSLFFVGGKTHQSRRITLGERTGGRITAEISSRGGGKR